jgi:hypothetical protein
MPRASETAVFAVSGGVACGEILSDTGAERFDGRAGESPYVGFLFHCYSQAWTGSRFRVFLGMGGPPLEVVAYSSRWFVPFQLKQDTGPDAFLLPFSPFLLPRPAIGERSYHSSSGSSRNTLRTPSLQFALSAVK